MSGSFTFVYSTRYSGYVRINYYRGAGFARSNGVHRRCWLLWRCTPDPSLRLKNGCAQDDAAACRGGGSTVSRDASSFTSGSHHFGGWQHFFGLGSRNGAAFACGLGEGVGGRDRAENVEQSGVGGDLQV